MWRELLPEMRSAGGVAAVSETEKKEPYLESYPCQRCHARAQPLYRVIVTLNSGMKRYEGPYCEACARKAETAPRTSPPRT